MKKFFMVFIALAAIVASCSKFELDEKNMVVEKNVQFSNDHVQWNRKGTLEGKVGILSCQNIVLFETIMSDGSVQKEQRVDYVSAMPFTINVPEIETSDPSKVIGQSFDFNDGRATVDGYELSVIAGSPYIVGKVEYRGKDYAKEIIPCVTIIRTITFTSSESAVLRFWKDDETDYAELEIAAKVVKRDATLERTDWTTQHVAWERRASWQENMIRLLCNNNLLATDIYSDGSKATAKVPYQCENLFSFTAPAMELENANGYVGKTYTFVNGETRIGAYTLKLTMLSARVLGQVMHNGKDYAKEITPCKATMQTLTINSLSRGTLKFWDQDKGDYAEIEVDLSIKDRKDPIVLIRTVVEPQHIAWERRASWQENMIRLLCNNNLLATDIYSDGSKATAKVPYQCENLFNFVAPAMELENANGYVGKTYTFVNGETRIEAYTLKLTMLSARVLGQVMHNGKDYAKEITPCKATMQTLTINSLSRGTLKFWDQDKGDYAEIEVDLSIKEKETPVTFEKTVWDYKHVAWTSATLSGSSIEARGNNLSDFYELWSDGSHRYAETIAYTCVNRFSHNIPAMELENTNTVVGKSFNFRNGVVTVAGYNVSVKRLSAEVEGSVVYRGKDYTKEITPCVLEARTITFTSTSTAVIRFYGEDSSDYVEVTIPVSIKETRKLVEISRQFVHKAFRSNAVVNGQNIAAVCDNAAYFIMKYNDGTQDAPVEVAYTVTNNFRVSSLEFKVVGKSEIVGKTYNFNNGTTVIAGKTVNVTFVSREVSNIMFGGTNYKSEAPACVATVRSITINDGSARIVFNGEGETVTAVVPCTITETDSIKGKIICGYATDSYVAGSQGVSVREGTYIHILALYNGVYTIYSKKVGADAWGMETVVSSADTAKRPFAFINNALNKVGYISVAEEYESGSYLINYSDFNGTLYKAIGKTSVTISGQPNRNPVRGTWSNGSITVDGQTFYISGTQN